VPDRSCGPEQERADPRSGPDTPVPRQGHQKPSENSHAPPDGHKPVHSSPAPRSSADRRRPAASRRSSVSAPRGRPTPRTRRRRVRAPSTPRSKSFQFAPLSGLARSTPSTLRRPSQSMPIASGTAWLRITPPSRARSSRDSRIRNTWPPPAAGRRSAEAASSASIVLLISLIAEAENARPHNRTNSSALNTTRRYGSRA